MPDHGIVVVGASAGGVEALIDLAASLPSDLPAAMFVVLHLPATGISALPEILRRHGPFPAAHVKDGEPIQPGRVYVAPPDHHVLLRTGHVHLSRGPRENGHRPAIDPLFRSAAREYATRVIGLVLSGALDDGTAGLLAIKSRGGTAVVQDPDDALYPGMPGNALEHAQVDHVAAAASMGKLLARRLAEPARRRGYTVTATRFEEQAAEAQQAARLVRDMLLHRDASATAWPLVGDRREPAGPPSTEAADG